MNPDLLHVNPGGRVDDDVAPVAIPTRSIALISSIAIAAIAGVASLVLGLVELFDTSAECDCESSHD